MAAARLHPVEEPALMEAGRLRDLDIDRMQAMLAVGHYGVDVEIVDYGEPEHYLRSLCLTGVASMRSRRTHIQLARSRRSSVLKRSSPNRTRAIFLRPFSTSGSQP